MGAGSLSSVVIQQTSLHSALPITAVTRNCLVPGEPTPTPQFWAFDSHRRKEQPERGGNAFKERERTQSEEKNWSCRKTELELSKVKAINCSELWGGKKHANDRVVQTKEWLLCRLTINYGQQLQPRGLTPVTSVPHNVKICSDQVLTGEMI